MPVLLAMFIGGLVATVGLALFGSHGWVAICKCRAEAAGREWYYAVALHLGVNMDATL